MPRPTLRPALRLILHPALLLTLLAASASAFAAGIDCKLARTPRERAICSSPRLTADDARLSAAYQRLRSQLSPEGAAALTADQRSWLTYLDSACPPHARAERANLGNCLSEEYSTRLLQLTQVTRLQTGNLAFTRAAFVVLPNTPEAEKSAPGNPGFGIGRFAWPQIDRPTPQQQAFNAAAQKAAVSITPDPKQAGTTPRAASDGDSQVDVTYAILGQNARLLIVSYELFSMTYGAAHPSTFDFNLTFRLDTGAALKPQDIFRPAALTSPTLASAVVRKLQADPDIKSMLWEGDELHKGIREGLSDTRNWTLSSTGFTVTYGQYQVAPYVAGMPAATFSWKELAPMLNPALNPADLPTIKAKAD